MRGSTVKHSLDARRGGGGAPHVCPVLFDAISLYPPPRMNFQTLMFDLCISLFRVYERKLKVVRAHFSSIRVPMRSWF